jgi:hypothetical protein
MLERTQFSISLTCSGCGQSGDARWEENSAISPSGPQRKLVGVSDGFRHEPQQQHMSGDPTIICKSCGTHQHD